MNIHGGWALIQATWLSWLQQRGFFFLLAFGWMIPPLISLFVWYTASDAKAIGGLTQGEFVSYYLLLILVNQFTYSQTHWTVGDAIRSGDMNLTLLRPLSPQFGVLASEIAGKVVYMSFVVPVTIVLVMLLHPTFHTTPANSILFLLTLFLAWLLRFLWGYWLAILAFWITRADALLSIQNTLIFLLAGQVAPVMLLPRVLQNIAITLPFRYMISFPIEVLLGHLQTSELIAGLVYQCCWTLIACILFVSTWHRGLRHYAAVGG